MSDLSSCPFYDSNDNSAIEQQLNVSTRDISRQPINRILRSSEYDLLVSSRELVNNQTAYPQFLFHSI